MGGAFHGGGFWDALGPTFPPGYLARDVVIADVLDAWFDPAPGVVTALAEDAASLARTSPPTHAEGVRLTLATARGVPPDALVFGAGSSDLIYRAIPQWIGPGGRALLTEPSYGEYAHLLGEVLGAEVERVPVADWPDALARGSYDLAVLVNPNNPTGEAVPAETILDAAERTRARVLVDEAYMDYLPDGFSVQAEAARRPNLAVVRSLSKGRALSGLRAAYLVMQPGEAVRLKALTPPWVLSGPAQIATIRALEDPCYYRARYRETHALRAQLEERLVARGLQTRTGVNWVLARIPGAAAFVAAAACRGAFVRDAGRTAPSLGDEWVRLAVGATDHQDRLLARLFP